MVEEPSTSRRSYIKGIAAIGALGAGSIGAGANSLQNSITTDIQDSVTFDVTGNYFTPAINLQDNPYRLTNRYQHQNVFDIDDYPRADLAQLASGSLTGEFSILRAFSPEDSDGDSYFETPVIYKCSITTVMSPVISAVVNPDDFDLSTLPDYGSRTWTDWYGLHDGPDYITHEISHPSNHGIWVKAGPDAAIGEFEGEKVAATAPKSNCHSGIIGRDKARLAETLVEGAFSLYNRYTGASVVISDLVDQMTEDTRNNSETDKEKSTTWSYCDSYDPYDLIYDYSNKPIVDTMTFYIRGYRGQNLNVHASMGHGGLGALSYTDSQAWGGNAEGRYWDKDTSSCSGWASNAQPARTPFGLGKSFSLMSNIITTSEQETIDYESISDPVVKNWADGDVVELTNVGVTENEEEE